MTDTLKLKAVMVGSGYTIKKMAEAMNLSYYGFYKKLTNKSGFKGAEISRAVALLGLSIEEKEMIFFAPDVAKLDTSA